MPSAKTVLYSLPLATVAVVIFALFVVGASRPYYGARIYGGPTENASSASIRVVVLERENELEIPASIGEFAVELTTEDGRTAARMARTDDLAMATLELPVSGPPLRGPVSFRVTRPGRQSPVLAEGRAELGVADWASKGRQLGGWMKGTPSGELLLRVAPGRGAFAVPFADPLWIEVRDAKGPVSGAKIELECDGVEPVGAKSATTSKTGRAVLNLAPRDNVASLRVIATTPGGARGEWYGSVPIAVGALRASVVDGKLRVESAVPTERAFWSIQSERARLAGGVAMLEPDGRGGAVAIAPLPALPHEKLWAVVSGEAELDSLSTLGWPLDVPDVDAPLALDPPLARSVADRLLLDGLVAGQRAEAVRRRHARWLAFGFSSLAALLAVLLLAREARSSAARLDRHLREAGAEASDADAIAERGSRMLSLVVALVCVGMGFAVVALVALYRMG